MKRPIVGFETDSDSHWMARLSCGHGQHVRHDPPMSERPWVLSEAGRAKRMGAELDCVCCDRFEMPDGHAPYKSTPVFDEKSVPAALLRTHSTRSGVWGLIHVAKGRLVYRVHAPLEREEVITPDAPGVVVAEVEHHVAPDGAVEFRVEFWRAAGPKEDAA